MKKRLISMVVALLTVVFLWTTLVQAHVDIYKLAAYVSKQSGSKFVAGEIKYHPGSMEYWRVRVYEEKSWTGVNRPEKLMGDANIDGKVDARDALIALYFGVYGNIQTMSVSTPPKTSYVLSWDDIYSAYPYKGEELEKKINSELFCWYYCQYNSPFFADVTKDCVANAKDALEILKYAVGKAEDFPEGDFTTISRDFNYFPWPTEYYPGIFKDLQVEITDQEFYEKYNVSWNISPTDQ